MTHASSLISLAISLFLAALPAFGRDTYTYTTNSTCLDLLIYQSYSSETSCSKTGSAGSQASSHRLMTAILLADGTPSPAVEATDSAGEQLVINGVTVQFERSDLALNKVTDIHPPPDGTSWVGFWSTELIPTIEGSEEMMFYITYSVVDDADKTSQKVIWVSNDGDTRNGDMVFGSGDVALMDPSTIFSDGFESGDLSAWSVSK